MVIPQPLGHSCPYGFGRGDKILLHSRGELVGMVWLDAVGDLDDLPLVAPCLALLDEEGVAVIIAFGDEPEASHLPLGFHEARCRGGLRHFEEGRCWRL